MYFTEINGNKATYYDDKLEIGDMTIRYGEIYDLTQTFEDTPVFKFKYKGFDFSIPCREDEYKTVLDYFIKAAELSPNTDPVHFLSSVKTAPENRKADAQKETENTERTQSSSYSYGYTDRGGQYEEEYDEPYPEGARSINKHLFVWVCSFFFGVFGADRFVRGQFLLGLIKLFTGGGLGYWFFFDWVIAMIKAYGSAYRDAEEVSFREDGSYTR